VLDEETRSAFLPNRRDTLTGAMLIAAVSTLPICAEPLPDDGGAFVMIDGWVFRRDDLPG
jgi:hypothetical protein